MAAHEPVSSLPADNLALALIAASIAPVLLLDGALGVIAASASFCQAFDLDPAAVQGRPLFELGEGEWAVPQLKALLGASLSCDAKIDAYEMDFVRKDQAPRHLVLNARRLDYAAASGGGEGGEGRQARLLLTIADVTDARLAETLKDNLLREKSLLLQEIQHRVANSLQIIASVLLQSARRVPNEETREHLYDAHNRVMSVAAMQQQLAASRLGEVELKAYFTELCASIGASMIRDHDQLTLSVDAEESMAGADASVSLGLIVTELVINALKHAFPGGRHGAIVVGYQASGSGWRLSVADDGVGMPKDPESTKAGLGTSIINALASQLQADVRTVDANPGTLVTITHPAAAQAAPPAGAVAAH